MIEAKYAAQKIVFAPFTFQAVRAMIDFGILKTIDDAGKIGITLKDIVKKTPCDSYAVSVLTEAAISAGILSQKADLLFSTKAAQCFLYDEMTRINLNLINDVCYKGAFYLKESLLQKKPMGLKVFGNWKTFYEAFTHLPKTAQKSWLEFDHFYSDNSFYNTIDILLKKEPKIIFDIGCNTGKFEEALFLRGYRGKVVLMDLQAQLIKAKKNLKDKGFNKNLSFYPINVLDKKSIFHRNPDIIFMSQFLDCFSEDEIIFILKKALCCMNDKSALYILEPFLDKQSFDAAKFSLSHISLYFTAIANGNSKMYKSKEMIECIKDAGLKVSQIHNNIGSYDYTLIECVK
jgi:SAM-dependent methyltransferase